MSVEEQHKLGARRGLPLADFRQHVHWPPASPEALDAKWRLVKSHLWMVPMIAQKLLVPLGFMDLVRGQPGTHRAAEVCLGRILMPLQQLRGAGGYAGASRTVRGIKTAHSTIAFLCFRHGGAALPHPPIIEQAAGLVGDDGGVACGRTVVLSSRPGQLPGTNVAPRGHLVRWRWR